MIILSADAVARVKPFPEKAIKERRSIRKYKPDMIPQEMIDEIMEAGIYAPSGHGKQSTKIIAITNKEVKDKLSVINGRVDGCPEGFDPFYGAPVIFVVLADSTWKTHVNDGSVSIENMLLAAHSLGLGACWVHRAKEEMESEVGKEILKQLGISEDWVGIGNCVVGYKPADAQNAAPRKENRTYYLK